MSKPRQNSSGFSNSHNQHSSRTKPTKRSADYAAKELQAAALINKGKLQEAEMICKQLIAEDARNHISYCNLAAISGIQGKLDNCIELLEKHLRLSPISQKVTTISATLSKIKGNYQLQSLIQL